VKMSMGTLKTAYELGSSRIIASKYKPVVKKDDNVLSEEEINTYLSKKKVAMPDFVKDVNHPLGYREEKQSEGDVTVQDPESIRYSDEMIEVHLNGNVMDYGGYGKMNRNIAFGLSNRNVRVKLDIEDYLVHVNKSTQKVLKNMANNFVPPTSPKIYGVTVPLTLSHKGMKIIFTMMETSEGIHPDYVGKLNLCDEIWVPTHYGKKMFENSNVHPPVRVIPLGVNVDRYKPGVEPFDFGIGLKDFRFISVFRWSYRKGYDILLKAYLEEFSSKDDVSLLLVSRPADCPEHQGVDRIQEDFKAIRECISKKDHELPHVALYNKPIPEYKMPAIYNASHAFALISRGEGFGLPYVEAAASGLPIIGSNCSGHSDFLNNDNSYLVEPEGFDIAEVTGNMHKMAKACRFYEGQPFPIFGALSIAQTQAHMRSVYENYSEAQEKIQILRADLVNNYTWDMMVERIYQRLLEIHSK